ncbi:MAG: 2'-5' RNA ligase family protein [Anaerolineaceae bacterium]|jgi:2'-5' RNA ligase
MQALVSTLPKPYEDLVLGLWDELEHQFGLKYVRHTPLPHFTWQLGESYQLEQVTALLEKISVKVEPFDVSVKGVESFISQTPIVFLKIVKSPTLLKLHSEIWRELLPFTQDADLLYSPALWHPHITLALQDLDWDNQKQVLDYLFAKRIDWRFMVDHFSILLQQPEGGIVLEHHFQFGKGKIY